MVDKFTEAGDAPGADGTFVDHHFYDRDELVYKTITGGTTDIRNDLDTRIHEYGVSNYGSGLLIDNGRLVVGAANAVVPVNANYAYEHSGNNAFVSKASTGTNRGAIFIYDLTKSTPAEVQDSEVAILRPAHTQFQATFGLHDAMMIAGGSLVVGDAAHGLWFYINGQTNIDSYDQYEGKGKVFVYDLTSGKLKNTIDPWEDEQSFLSSNSSYEASLCILVILIIIYLYTIDFSMQREFWTSK